MGLTLNGKGQFMNAGVFKIPDSKAVKFEGKKSEEFSIPSSKALSGLPLGDLLFMLMVLFFAYGVSIASLFGAS